MKYMGLAVCEVYAPTNRASLSDLLIMLKKFWKTPNVKIPSRIYSDEVIMCSGMQAFRRMERAFKSKWLGKWEAWQAWRRLV